MDVNAEKLIEARGLTRRYGPNIAVSQLDLDLRQGEILGLLGPNGAGKSTTMKMLTGNLAPSAGRVLIKGEPLHEQATRAKRHLGYLPEQPPVYQELSVDEYLRYCAGLHGIARKERAQAVDAAKRDCGLAKVGRRVIGNLSKGFQQRVGIAQAILHRPPVVILDEPTVGLDPIQIREIRELIRELGRHHSVILSSHILPEIQAVCDRVMIISQGRVVYDASIDAHARDNRLVLECARPPSTETLLDIDGVRAVESLGEGRLSLQLAEGSDPREVLVRHAVAHDWGLRELRLQSKTLEEIFVELSAGDAATQTEALVAQQEAA